MVVISYAVLAIRLISAMGIISGLFMALASTILLVLSHPNDALLWLERGLIVGFISMITLWFFAFSCPSKEMGEHK